MQSKLAAIISAALLLCAQGAEARCRQALALGLDVSGSVDTAEYRLQLDGLASALQDPDVVAALLAMPQAPVRIAVYEWSGPEAQRLVLDWKPVTSQTDIQFITDRLRATGRALTDRSTALGQAKRFGAALLGRQPGCWRHVLDISGDGISNTGPRPQEIRPRDVDINALVIGSADGGSNLQDYFGNYVIQGPDAFVETASTFADYRQAMTRKLLRELTVLAVSSAD